MRRKKKPGCCPRGATARSRYPSETPKRFRGTATLACTRDRLPDLYPEACACGGSPPVGTGQLPSTSQVRRPGACWFLFWWLYLHLQSTFWTTRLNRSRAAFATPSVNYSVRAPSRFYPRGSGDARRPSPCADLSVSAGASVAATFAACRCPRIETFPPRSADPHAGRGCRNNRDGSRTIRMRAGAVNTFLQKKIRVELARFSGHSRHLKTSSTGDFHRWKFHPRFVENFRGVNRES